MPLENSYICYKVVLILFEEYLFFINDIGEVYEQNTVIQWSKAELYHNTVHIKKSLKQ